MKTGVAIDRCSRVEDEDVIIGLALAPVSSYYLRDSVQEPWQICENFMNC